MVGWLSGIGVAAAGLALVCNLPTSLWLSAERATLKLLASTTLRTIDSERKSFPASDLWRNNAVVMMVVRRPG